MKITLELLPEEAEVLQDLLWHDEGLPLTTREDKQILNSVCSKLDEAISAVCQCCVCQEERGEA